MNWKKFFIALVAAFIFIFLFGFTWYGVLMNPIHQEIPALFRPEAEFRNYFAWLVFGHLVMAFFLTLLCARYTPAGGAGGGARLGFMTALIYAGADFITYAVQPLTTKMLAGWIVGDLLMFATAGAIIGAIYRPGPLTSGANV
jgi:hypothetical protein